MSAAPPLRQPAAWTVRAQRRESRLQVEFSGPTTPAFSGRVRNVSASGMLIDSPHDLSAGDVLTARMPNKGEMLCRVVRVTSKGAGIRFLQPVDDDEAADWA